MLSTNSCRARLVGDVGQPGDVGDAQQRVGRRLAPDQLGLRPQRRPDRVQVPERHRGIRQTPWHTDLVDQPEGAAVGVVRDDQVIAGTQHARGSWCRTRPSRTRRRSRAGRPPGWPAPAPGRSGSGSRPASSRIPPGFRRPRPARRWTSGRSAPTTAPVSGSGSWPAWMARVEKPSSAWNVMGVRVAAADRRDGRRRHRRRRPGRVTSPAREWRRIRWCR